MNGVEFDGVTEVIGGLKYRTPYDNVRDFQESVNFPSSVFELNSGTDQKTGLSDMWVPSTYQCPQNTLLQ